MNNQTTISKDLFVKKFADLCLKNGMSGLPKDETDQHILLKSMAIFIGPEESLTEQEIKEKLSQWITRLSLIKDLDHVTLRRRLVDTGYLIRSSDGASYHTAATGPYMPTFDAEIDRLDLAEIIRQRREEVERRRQEFMNKNRPA
jgi:hypothetical protein